MKKSDIKIGTEYAERRGSYGSPTRVKVISLDGRYTQGWGYSRKTISGAVVQNVAADGTLGPERTVPNRQILEEWAPYAERERQAAAARRSSEIAARDGRRERAAHLLDLIPALRHAGVEDTETQVWDRNSKFVAALIHAGLEGDILVKREESERDSVWGDQYTLTAPLARSLEDYVVHNRAFTVPVSVLDTIVKA